MYTVRVTLPNHREHPGMVVAQHSFKSRSGAIRYIARVRSHETGVYDAELLHGKLPSFDVTRGS